MNDIKDLELLAKANALKFTDKGNGHVQLENHGALINFWPLSKRRTVHVKGGQTHYHCSNWDAVKICMQSGKPGIRPKKKHISENRPQFDLTPEFTNRAGSKHFYDGKTPPWEFPSMIRCWPDIYRSEAKELLDKAEEMECPARYEDAVGESTHC